jgi:hypothetical protein
LGNPNHSLVTNLGTHHDKAAKKPGAHKNPKAEIVVKHSLVGRSNVARSSIQPEIQVPAYVASDVDLPVELFQTPVPVTEEA